MSEHVDTICVQGGYQPGNGESRTPPIIQATTFKYTSSEQMSRLFDLSESGYFYTRLQNPTNDTVAAKICEMEGGVAAMLTSSGQAANFFALFNICNEGDHIVASSAIYGGTFNLINVTMRKMGVTCTFVSPDCSEEELEAAFQPNTKAVFGESIANPALIVLDFEKFAEAAHRHGVPLIVDNTFPTPINCRPIEFGVDIVTHATTKYMDGHGSCVGGAIVDSGNFDWMAHAEKFPGLTTPDDSYHAWCTPRTSARPRSSPRPPRSSCATSAPPRRRSTRGSWACTLNPWACAWSATARTHWPWPSSSRPIRASRGSASLACRMTATMRSPKSTCPTARAV